MSSTLTRTGAFLAGAALLFVLGLGARALILPEAAPVESILVF